jgi:hypothetical protein
MIIFGVGDFLETHTDWIEELVLYDNRMLSTSLPGKSSFHACSTSGLKNSDVLYGAKV